MSPLDQARRYFAKVPPAISGQEGHKAAFYAASRAVNGFGLGAGDALMLLREWNAGCQPPWTEAELEHKVSDAIKAAHDKPHGHLLREESRMSNGYHPAPTPAPAPAVKAATYQTAGRKVPTPIPDGTRTFLRELFREGECVRVVEGHINEEGTDKPVNNGLCLPRDEWLARLDKVDGNPNRIWKRSPQPGLFFSVNPMRPDGKKATDVTDYRYGLLEFDKIDLETQWSIIEQSDVPCAAVTFSGGKSIHALIKVMAKDAKEYAERMKLLYAHFANYGPDKTSDPSRLSRLPGCNRLGKRQELLSLGRGRPSWIEWANEQLSTGVERLSFDDLLAYDSATDADVLLGRRWLCKGGSVVFVGPSGVGKSSLAVQMAVQWALGRPAFGVTPTRPLRTLIIQAENDLGDTSEMVQGILAGLGITTPEEKTKVKANLIFYRDRSHTGQAFITSTTRLIEAVRPDIVAPDPLLSFIGDDISKQAVCAQFLRNGLGPVTQETGVAWMFTHHSGKPSNDPKRDRNQDWSYFGIGSSELTNWARAVVALRSVDGGLFELRFAKRGGRAGASHPNGGQTSVVYLRHDPDKIFWEQVTPEKPPEGSDDGKSQKGGRPSKIDRALASGLGLWIDAIPAEGAGLNQLARSLTDWIAKEKKLDIGMSSCKDVIGRLLENGKVTKADGLYRRL